VRSIFVAGIVGVVVLAGCSAQAATESQPAEQSPAAPETSSTPAAPTSSAPPSTSGYGFGESIAIGRDTGPGYSAARRVGESSVVFTHISASEGEDPLVLTVVGADGTVSAEQTLDDVPSGCGTAQVVLNGSPALAVLAFDATPAEGTIPAQYDVRLDVFDAALAVTTSVTVASDLEGEPSCATRGGYGVTQGDAPISNDTNAWSLVGASADGTYALVSRGMRTNGADGYMVVPADDKVVKVPAQIDRVIGNAVHHGCARSSDSGLYQECAGDPQTPRGTLLYKSVNFDTKVYTDGFCGKSDANCDYIVTGDPQGAVGINGPGDEWGTARSRLVNPLTSSVVARLPGWYHIESAAYDATTGTFALAAGKEVDGDELRYIIGVNRSGKVLWKVKGGGVCGATRDGFVVTANEQVALLSPSGEQLASTTNLTSCPVLGFNGIGFVNGMGDGGLVSLQP